MDFTVMLGFLSFEKKTYLRPEKLFERLFSATVTLKKVDFNFGFDNGLDTKLNPISPNYSFKKRTRKRSSNGLGVWCSDALN